MVVNLTCVELRTKHIGVTLFDGRPVMCVVIMTGKKRDLLVESGLDWNNLKEMDDDYIENSQDFVF